jgi:hypothetical protein
MGAQEREDVVVRKRNATGSNKIRENGIAAHTLGAEGVIPSR